MERKHYVMIILVIIFVAAVLDLSWNKEEVFENFFAKVELHEEVGGVGINESIPTAIGNRKFILEETDIDTLLVNNFYGKTHVEGTEADTIQLEVELIVYADEKELAEQVLKDLEIKKEIKGTNLVLGLEDDKVLPRGVREIRSNFTVYIPERLSLNLRNHGDLGVKNIWGEVKINNFTGTAMVTGVHNNLEIYQRSGTLMVKDIEGNLELKMNFGEASGVDILGNVKIDASNSEIDLAQITGNVEIDNRYGKIFARQISGNLIADLRHNPITVDGVSGRVYVDNWGGNVELINVQKDIRVTNKEANIRIRTDYNHQVMAKTEYGKIYGQENQLKVEVDENRVKAEGTLGEGKYQMELVNRYGDIDIQ